MESRDSRLPAQQQFLVSLTRFLQALTLLVVDQTGRVAARSPSRPSKSGSAPETMGKLGVKADERKPAMSPEPTPAPLNLFD